MKFGLIRLLYPESMYKIWQPIPSIIFENIQDLKSEILENTCCHYDVFKPTEFLRDSTDLAHVTLTIENSNPLLGGAIVTGSIVMGGVHSSFAHYLN